MSWLDAGMKRKKVGSSRRRASHLIGSEAIFLGYNFRCLCASALSFVAFVSGRWLLASQSRRRGARGGSDRRWTTSFAGASADSKQCSNQSVLPYYSGKAFRDSVGPGRVQPASRGTTLERSSTLKASITSGVTYASRTLQFHFPPPTYKLHPFASDSNCIWQSSVTRVNRQRHLVTTEWRH